MLSTKDFNYHNQVLSADRSDFLHLDSHKLTSFTLSERIAIKSHHTGRVITFVFVQNVYDDEHDLVCTEYEPEKLQNQEAKYLPEYPVAECQSVNVKRLLIYND